ncbi:MAG: phosphomannomutase [Gammaproteobacteria bacterium]|nr:phosphomannomutase [Gammaproteobacteria bacterium]
MTEQIDLTPVFNAYDVRGLVSDQLKDKVVYRIGRAYTQWLNPETVVVGRDIRATSDALFRTLSDALIDGGANVIDIGVGGTEEVYFATVDQQASGGIMITASHNPIGYNGFKFVREQSKPISSDNGLLDIKKLAEQGEFDERQKGSIRSLGGEEAYVQHLLSYVNIVNLNPLKIVVNAGNGGAGKVIDLLASHLPFEFVRVHHEPDPAFPNGVPNPLLPENRQDTIDAVRSSSADLGIAWDGDFDRCFFFDETGAFVEGYYLVGLLASHFLEKKTNQTVVHDPRLTWNSIDIIENLGGHAQICRTGHSFIKQMMREVDGVYGGEMSAHHYFRDFAYCDSGMIPWLLVTEIISNSEKPLSELVGERVKKFPASGEINRRVTDAQATIDRIQTLYEPKANLTQSIDGLSLEFEDWRFSLRCSNTEPLLRLNVESRGDVQLMQQKTDELLALIDGN